MIRKGQERKRRTMMVGTSLSYAEMDAYVSTKLTRMKGSWDIRRDPCFHDFLRHCVQSTAICVWVIFVHRKVEPIGTVDLSVYKSGANDVPLHVYDFVWTLHFYKKSFLCTILVIDRKS